MPAFVFIGHAMGRGAAHGIVLLQFWQVLRARRIVAGTGQGPYTILQVLDGSVGALEMGVKVLDMLAKDSCIITLAVV